MRLAILFLAAATTTKSCASGAVTPGVLGCSAEGKTIAAVPDVGIAYDCTATFRPYGECGPCNTGTQSQLIVVAGAGHEYENGALPPIDAANACWEWATLRDPEVWSVQRSCIYRGPWQAGANGQPNAFTPDT